MKRNHCTETSSTTIDSLPPELIKVVFAFLLRDVITSVWPPIILKIHFANAEGVDSKKAEEKLSIISRVSSQWACLLCETMQEDYSRTSVRTLAKTYHQSDWFMRQVAPVVKDFELEGTSTITDSTVAQFTNCQRWISIFHPQRVSEQGFSHLTNLTHLKMVLSPNDAWRWSLLQHFTKLIALETYLLGEYPVLEIYPSMISLARLSLDYRIISRRGPSDFTQLSRLTNLTDLRIRSHLWHAEDSLRLLTRLVSLKISGVSLTTEIVASVPQIRVLGIGDDCRLLGNLTNLRALHLSGRLQSGLRCASSLTSLQCLVVDDVSSNHLQELSHLTSLTILGLSQCPSIKPEHLSPLTRLCCLTYVNCLGLKDYNSNLPPMMAGNCVSPLIEDFRNNITSASCIAMHNLY